MDSITTVKIATDTKNALDNFREYKNESYDEVIRKIVSIAENVKKNPKLSKEAIDAIEKARARIKAGDYLTAEEMHKRLGL